MNRMPLIAMPEPNLAAVQLPDRSVRPEVIREVLRACRNQSTPQNDLCLDAESAVA